MRLDVYLFKNNYVKSRQKAKSLIEGGNVVIDGRVMSKASIDIDEMIEHVVEITDDCPFVSRGGLKLQAVFENFKINVNNKICIDIGASTGGFTHCLLLNGAGKVYAIDSGNNQLDESLKNNEKVFSIEGYNARNIAFEDIGQLVNIITIDVSFISQTLIIPKLTELLTDDGLYISLIKPQFEVGKSNIGKGGIVKEKKAVISAIVNVINVAKICGLYCTQLMKSPILGGDGNTEYLAVFSKKNNYFDESIIKRIVMN